VTAPLHESPFVDAQEMHRLHPDTFDAPSEEDLAALATGDTVKVCPDYERFWAVIEAIDHDDDVITARIANRLMCSAKHGFHDGDVIHFQRRHVYLIHKAGA
jgi:hypothetical protein